MKNRNSKVLRWVLMGVLTTLVLATGLPFDSARSRASDIKRTDLQKHDLSIPGHEVVQVRVDIPPGVTAPRHSHPGEEIVYVIEGTVEYRLDGQSPVRLKAGEVLFIPSGVIHEAKAIGADNAAELATYIVEKGKPLVVPAK